MGILLSSCENNTSRRALDSSQTRHHRDSQKSHYQFPSNYASEWWNWLQCLQWLLEWRMQDTHSLPTLQNLQGGRGGGGSPSDTPIISAVSSHTEKISQLDHFLNPSAQRAPSYIWNTTHFLTLLEDMNHLPAHTWLVTTDMTLIYTVTEDLKNNWDSCSQRSTAWVQTQSKVTH